MSPQTVCLESKKNNSPAPYSPPKAFQTIKEGGSFTVNYVSRIISVSFEGPSYSYGTQSYTPEDALI